MNTENEKSKEQEFHDNRLAFYIENGYEHELKVLPKGLSHKQALSWRYEAVEKYYVRGYLKDRHLMLYQGENFEVPTEEYDFEKIFRDLNITKSQLDYIGLGCKVGEIGEEWEPLEKIEISHNPKYISYMITIGGDAGWRFSNGEEWCSTEYILLFESDKWTMEKIGEEMKHLWRQYWDGNHGWTYAETYDLGAKYVKDLIDHDGVYVYKGGLEAPKEKTLEPSPAEIEVWNIDGKIKNYEYSK